jgi:hypothetical protein
MVTVAQCGSIDEALLLKSLLEGSGIPAWVPDELTAQTAPPYMFASGSGVRLQVEDEQAESALALIAAAGHDGGTAEAPEAE